MKDKREHRRYPILATAVIKAENGRDALPVESLVANISRSGLGLYSYSRIEKGVPVSIEITFVSLKGSKRKDTVEGEVVWLSKLGRLYYIGVVFDEELNPAKQSVLYEHFWKVTSWD